MVVKRFLIFYRLNLGPTIFRFVKFSFKKWDICYHAQLNLRYKFLIQKDNYCDNIFYCCSQICTTKKIQAHLTNCRHKGWNTYEMTFQKYSITRYRISSIKSRPVINPVHANAFSRLTPHMKMLFLDWPRTWKCIFLIDPAHESAFS